MKRNCKSCGFCILDEIWGEFKCTIRKATIVDADKETLCGMYIAETRGRKDKNNGNKRLI